MARGAQRLLAVGASAGGVEALTALVAGLPADLDAGVVVTVHISPHARSHLPEILGRAGPLPAAHARTGEPLLPGRIHVAPPGQHLVVDHGRALLSNGPRVNRQRPSVDVMLASATRWAGPRVVAAVLSGVLDDGAVGAALVAQAGGRVVVQEPAEAAFPGMPRAALDAAPGARAVRTADLGAAVASLLDVDGARAPLGGAAAVAGAPGGSAEVAVGMADSGDPVYLAPEEARLTRLVCPECHGSLAQVDLPQISYFRCHVGHEYAPQSLAAAQADASEAKLWTAVAALEEQAALSRHLVEHAGSRSGAAASDGSGLGAPGPDGVRLRRAAERATDLADVLRGHLQPPTERESED